MSEYMRPQSSPGIQTGRQTESSKSATRPPLPTPPPSFRPSFSAIDSSQDETYMEGDEGSTTISWPIVLAVIPTLGAFFAGSAEIWSDFVISLLILYYVYKWMTVPWSQYEEARSRRIIHQNATARRSSFHATKQSSVADELRRHERVGLFWVIASPCIVAYSLRFSHYLLTNHERYLTYFNVGIFVLAALIKPFEHVVSHLQERAEQLQREVKALGIDKREIDVLQAKTDAIAAELEELYEATATKQDLRQITSELNPMLQELAKALYRVEKKKRSFQRWSEERFQALDIKFNELDSIITHTIEQDQRRSTQRTFVTLMFLPVNTFLWIVNLARSILPAALTLQQSAILSSALPSPSTSTAL